MRFVARGRHLEALRQDGLRVESVNGNLALPVFASDDPAEIEPSDFVLFCVKSYDTQSAAARLRPLLHDGTAVVSLQNGVDNEDKLITDRLDGVVEDNAILVVDQLGLVAELNRLSYFDLKIADC